MYKVKVKETRQKFKPKLTAVALAELINETPQSIYDLENKFNKSLQNHLTVIFSDEKSMLMTFKAYLHIKIRPIILIDKICKELGCEISDLIIKVKK